MATATTDKTQVMNALKVEVAGILKKVHSPFKEIVTIVPEPSGRVTGTFRNQGNKVFNYEVSDKGAAISPITNQKNDSLFDYTHMDSVEYSEVELAEAARRWNAMSLGYLRSYGIRDEFSR